VSAGPYRNYHSKAGTKNEPWHVFGTISKKGLENWSSRFEPKNSWLSVSRGSGLPLNKTYRYIAQVVQDFFPEAVSLRSEYLPNGYVMCDMNNRIFSINLNPSTYTLILEVGKKI